MIILCVAACVISNEEWITMRYPVIVYLQIRFQNRQYITGLPFILITTLRLICNIQPGIDYYALPCNSTITD
jgi:hypothetical protein